MSTIITGQCWMMVMTPTQKAVLISLGDNANDQGICWPSMAYIEARTNLKTRAIRNALRDLEDMGVLRTLQRAGWSTYYQITPEGFTGEVVRWDRDAYALHKEAGLVFSQPMQVKQTPAFNAGVVSAGQDQTPASGAGVQNDTPASDDMTPASGAATPARGAPITVINHQEPEREDAGEFDDRAARHQANAIDEATRTVQLTREALRQAGRHDFVQRVVSHLPDLHAALAEGITPEVIAATTAEFADRASPFAYAIRTARNRHAEGAKPAHSGDTHANHSERHSRRTGLSLAEQAARGIAERDAAEQGGQHFAGEPIDVEFCDAPGFEDGY